MSRPNISHNTLHSSSETLRSVSERFKDCRVLFVLHDAGETNAFQPLFQILDEMEMDYDLLLGGTAKKMLSDHKRRIEDCQGQHYELVITGTISQFQLDLLQQFQGPDTYVIGYYDSFEPLHKQHIACDFLPRLNEILVPSEEVATSISAFNPDLETHVVGQPALETWMRPVEPHVLEALRKRYSEGKAGKLLLYAGGYDASYVKAFEVFLCGLQGCRDVHVVLALHPRSNGSIERKLMAKYPGLPIEIAERGVSTRDLVHLADVVVSHRSTVGVQAVFLDKRVVYVDFPESTYSNLAIRMGWAQQVRDPESFQKLLCASFEGKEHTSACRFREGGVPRSSTQLILGRIHRRIRRQRRAS